VLDPDAVGRLLWAGMGGRLGQRARIVSCAVLILAGTTLAWAWTRPTAEPSAQAPAKPPAKARRPAAATSATPANPEKKRRRTTRPATPRQEEGHPAEPGD